MNKIYFYALSAVLFLAGCASQPPNLLHSHQPILNIEASLAPVLAVDLYPQRVIFKNKAQQTTSFSYTITWYDRQGVTQLFSGDKAEQQILFQLAPQQQIQLNLEKPTEASVNYRIYIAPRS